MVNYAKCLFGEEVRREMKGLLIGLAEQTVFQAFHILNQFDIPNGVARSVEKNGIHADFTQATCVRDPKSLKYYFKTYQDQTVRCIDLSRFDAQAKTVKRISTSGFEKSVDISKELK